MSGWSDIPPDHAARLGAKADQIRAALADQADEMRSHAAEWADYDTAEAIWAISQDGDEVSL